MQLLQSNTAANMFYSFKNGYRLIDPCGEIVTEQLHMDEGKMSLRMRVMRSNQEMCRYMQSS